MWILALKNPWSINIAEKFENMQPTCESVKLGSRKILELTVESDACRRQWILGGSDFETHPNLFHAHHMMILADFWQRYIMKSYKDTPFVFGILHEKTWENFNSTNWIPVDQNDAKV